MRPRPGRPCIIADWIRLEGVVDQISHALGPPLCLEALRDFRVEKIPKNKCSRFFSDKEISGVFVLTSLQAFLDIGWQCDSIKWRIIPDSAVSIWTSTSKSIESRCSQTAQSCATRAH
ncbi:unnamed protein product [Bursaphelenchus xylophilus]|uniref:(pine wood nematode) hypothetical protein n=1 Tax=Bursaphelenchus xylophilus TaxID=6326 RepID=A0A7I8WSQ1_BURXY|nr:unnamed protein product [Bursaphelenchus xylophilus]CAG9115668.1 unnamed protein product [Bursaphelenchus xylophilus]